MAEAPVLLEMAEKPKLTFADLKKYFCHSGIYRKSGPEWPEETVIYYQVSRELAKNNEAEQLGDGQQADRFNNQLHIQRPIAEWLRIENSKHEKHAEEKMIVYVKTRKEINELEKGDTLELRMVMSYSPCNDCSELLLKFKQGIKEEKKAHVKISIKVANFYMHPQETRGLSELAKNDFNLTVFEGLDDWRCFYEDVNGRDIRGLCKARVKREQRDKEILAEITGNNNT